MWIGERTAADSSSAAQTVVMSDSRVGCSALVWLGGYTKRCYGATLRAGVVQSKVWRATRGLHCQCSATRMVRNVCKADLYAVHKHTGGLVWDKGKCCRSSGTLPLLSTLR